MEEQEVVKEFTDEAKQIDELSIIGKEEAVSNLIYNLAIAQSHFESALKGTSGYGYKYADIEAVWDSIGPALAEQEIFVSQFSVEAPEGHVAVSTFIAGHGALIKYPPMIVPYPPENDRMDAPKRVGAGNTYARRYALEAIFCLSRSEDTDASPSQPGQAISLSPRAIATKYKISLDIALKLGKESRGTGKSIDELISELSDAEKDKEIDNLIDERTGIDLQD